MDVWPGRPYPLGATYDGSGTNFSLFSELAEGVELCLFEDDGTETRVELPEVSAYCWHGYIPGAQPGQRYGFRVHGPWDPDEGRLCNANKLLVDPYAKAIEGEVRWDPAVYGYELDSGEALEMSTTDSAPYVPKGIVTNPFFDWGNEPRPSAPLHESMIYEVHVKGFTARHPQVSADRQGTYAGLTSPEAIEHLQKLGITAVELLPVHHFVHDQSLIDRGLRNYWGYNTLGFLAPHSSYSSTGEQGQQVNEFKTMVKTLHEAGIEVILDVVYNHTAEGSHLGPTLSFRGIDNVAYYRLMEGDLRHYMDYTGTGNSLNMRHPHVLQLLMDSLRYWITEMHVDGFRFDLAATLARELHDVDRLSAFFDVIQQDPVVSQVKLIAEPWDVGEGGYQVGNFPPLWSEWNGKYRDCMRDFWRGQEAGLAEFAYRLTGSSDLYESNGRRPYASVNFITAHDGFTLNDLVSYNEKHNEANGEENRDGESHNRSWNHGVEGPTKDRKVVELRERQKRNFLATLILSQGVPMLLGGDEIGRTQRGNNNGYCQDNELSWFDWNLDERAHTLLAFTQRLTGFRQEHPVLRRRRWFQGLPIRPTGAADVQWFTEDGEVMTDEHWRRGFAKSLAMFLNGEGILTLGPRGERVVDDSLLLLFNAHHETIDFVVPPARWGREWALVFDTADVDEEEGNRAYAPGEEVAVTERSVVVLRRVR